MARIANSADTVADFAEHIGRPLAMWQRGFVAAAEFEATARQVRATFETTHSSRRLFARLFDISLIDIDPALRAAVRRDHVAYRRRQLARRRRRR